MDEMREMIWYSLPSTSFCEVIFYHHAFFSRDDLLSFHSLFLLFADLKMGPFHAEPRRLLVYQSVQGRRNPCALDFHLLSLRPVCATSLLPTWPCTTTTSPSQPSLCDPSVAIVTSCVGSMFFLVWSFILQLWPPLLGILGKHWFVGHLHTVRRPGTIVTMSTGHCLLGSRP